jgi:Flp pilus assembly protein TadB
MIVFLTLVMVIVMIVAVRMRSREKLEESKMALPSYRRMVKRRKQSLADARKKKTLRKLAEDIGIGDKVRLFPLYGCVIGLGIGAAMFRNPIFGGIVGFLTPYFVLKITSRFLSHEYHEQVKDTMRFMSASFASGGQVEDCIEELQSRVSGKLRKEVRASYALMKNGTPARDNLLRWSSVTDEPNFAYALRQLAKAMSQSGDLVTIMDESLQELLGDEQFERSVRTMSKSSRNMIIAMVSFPIFSFFLFRHVIGTLLREVPWLWGVLVIGLGLIGLVLVWYRKVTNV